MLNVSRTGVRKWAIDDGLAQQFHVVLRHWFRVREAICKHHRHLQQESQNTAARLKDLEALTPISLVSMYGSGEITERAA